MLYEKDGDLSLIRASRVAVLGFGAQGRAQALNLRDSGVDVVVGLRENSASQTKAESEGLKVATPAAAVTSADVVAMLVPDTVQPAVYQQMVAPHLKAGGALVFAHGYCVNFKQITPRQDMDILLVAPLGVGEQVRAVYERGGGVPGMIAVKQDASGNGRALALSYALANGHGRAGIIETDFAQETETDLFAEQAVLCGGLTHLIQAGFDTLVEAGYDPQIAYFCCLHEVKLLADLIHTRGLAGMRESISPIAEYGDYTRGPRVINEQSRNAMRDMLAEIRDGSFARELAADMANDQATLQKGRQAAREHLIETTGKRLRDAMPWLKT
ncbi:MAG TPA: ketol-acid reductoisomerase [Gammaproteobacteria bacterium]|nr:ketol-acid reductoisomerase [Gammaproteobacteria bacterium]